MTKRILSVILSAMLILSFAAFSVSADEELVFYVEAGATGDGTEEAPFGTLESAIFALNGKDGVVYVYGSLNLSSFDCPAWNGWVTLQGVNEDSAIVLDNGRGVVFNGNIIFKDIDFSLGESSHFNPGTSASIIMDGGEDSYFGSFMHLSAYEDRTVEEGNFVLESGKVNILYACGGYSSSYGNGVMGDANITINGGSVKNIFLDADAYMETQTGISIGGNLNVVINGGEVDAIKVLRNEMIPEIMGALNIIFNNGTETPKEFSYPEETVTGGVFVVRSGIGGKILPTSEAGVFEVVSDDENTVAQIDGELVYNGTVELAPGETEVEWVAGQQPEKPVEEEKTEIKLTIGKAAITVNGEDKALDVPAQIVDSRTLVPVRAIAESFGCDVAWDDATKTVTITK